MVVKTDAYGQSRAVLFLESQMPGKTKAKILKEQIRTLGGTDDDFELVKDADSGNLNDSQPDASLHCISGYKLTQAHRCRPTSPRTSLIFSNPSTKQRNLKRERRPRVKIPKR